jgi:small GTP-binding protein
MSAKKVMLLGDIGVGKSSIVQRLVFDRFQKSYKPTIGVDIYRYSVPRTGGDPMTLIVWDTDGNFGDSIFRHVYIREAAAAFIVSDVTRPETFQSAKRLAQLFVETLPGRPAVLLRNKCDLAPTPLPNADMDEAKHLMYWTSALSGDNIEKAFVDTALTIERRHV